MKHTTVTCDVCKEIMLAERGARVQVEEVEGSFFKPTFEYDLGDACADCLARIKEAVKVAITTVVKEVKK